MRAGRQIAVVGGADADEETLSHAIEVGRRLAELGCVLVTGGLGGVMEAASLGASEAGGVAIGLLPGFERADANAYVTVTIPTGLGELRNGLVVRAADAVVAIGGGYGTLSEVALALKAGKRVVGLGFSYAVEGVATASDPADAVTQVLA